MHKTGCRLTYSQHFAESQQLFDDAMKKGYVRCHMMVVLLIGTAGSGKTHVKCLLLGQNPPPIRQSTPLAEEPVRAISLSRATLTGSSIWRKVDLDDFERMIVNDFKKEHTSEPPQHPYKEDSSHRKGTAFTEEVIMEENAPVDIDKDVSDIQQELQDMVTNARESQESHEQFEVNWVYIIDSGGQPQFEALLHAFINKQSAALCVTKLNEQLTDRPERPYYDRSGKRWDKTSSSPLSNEDILKRNFQTIHSLQCTTSEGKDSSLFVVGTHKDCEDESSETRAEKNRKLVSLLDPIFEGNLGYYSAGKEDEVIFPLNAKTPDREDVKVAQNLREKIEKKCRGHPVKIPFPWFVFEMFLRRLATKKGVKILSLQECEAVGEKLHMQSDASHAALVFLAKHNVLYYNPDHLQGVVFVGSQVLLSLVTALVYLSYVLGESKDDVCAPLQQRCCGKEWFDFRDYGLLTTELLGSREFQDLLTSEMFDVPYRPSVFTPVELFDLLKGLQIIAPMTEGSKQYVMPSLLPELPSFKGDEHRQNSSSLVCPLIIHYPKRLLPAGIFTFLIAYLRNKATLPWELTLTDTHKPSCLFFNCGKFRLPTQQRRRGTVTLLHFFEYLEVHVRSTDVDACRQACPQIAQDIIGGLKAVAQIHGYKNLGDPECAFLCPSRGLHCKEDSHLATIDRDEWFCTCNDEIGGKLEETHNLWFHGRCSVKQ